MSKGYGNYYPAFLPKESAIWGSFLNAHPDLPRDIDYNVRVGKGFDPGPSVPDESRQSIIKNSQLRLDAVVYWQNEWWIFEVKVRAGAGCVGQLQQYEVLYEEAYPTNRPIQLAIVTDRERIGMPLLCARHDIALFVQPVVVPLVNPP